MLNNNQERVSVAETSSTSEDKNTTLTPITRESSEISSGFCPEKKVRGTQSQRILTNLSPHKNVTHNNKVVVQ